MIITNKNNCANFVNLPDSGQTLIPFDKKGNKINIKKENKGKFTKYCNGKVTEECISKGKNSKDPKIRKRATFAANARKWAKKHDKGGELTKQLKNTKKSKLPITYNTLSKYVISNDKLIPQLNLNINPALDYVGNALESVSGYEYEGNPLNKLGINMSFNLGTIGNNLYLNGIKFTKKFLNGGLLKELSPINIFDKGGTIRENISFYELANNPQYGFHLEENGKDGQPTYYNASTGLWFLASKIQDKDRLSEIKYEQEQVPVTTNESNKPVELPISSTWGTGLGFDLYLGSTYGKEFQDELHSDPTGLKSIFGQRRFDLLGTSYDPSKWDIATNVSEGLNWASSGLVSKFSPGQLVGFARDLYNGKNFMESWYGLNSGWTTELFAAENPKTAFLLNALGDGLVMAKGAGLYNRYNPETSLLHNATREFVNSTNELMRYGKIAKSVLNTDFGPNWRERAFSDFRRPVLRTDIEDVDLPEGTKLGDGTDDVAMLESRAKNYDLSDIPEVTFVDDSTPFRFFWNASKGMPWYKRPISSGITYAQHVSQPGYFLEYNNIPLIKATDYNGKYIFLPENSVRAHEMVHSYDKYANNYTNSSKFNNVQGNTYSPISIDGVFDLSRVKGDILDYFKGHNYTELKARGSLLKSYYGNKPLTGDMLKYAAKHYKLNNNMTEFFNTIVDWDKAAEWINTHSW